MNQYSWQQSQNTKPKNKRKSKNQQNYDDDFQPESNLNKKQKSSFGLPKIQSKSINKAGQKNKYINVNVSDQDNYQNDFQPASQKKLQKNNQTNKNQKLKNKKSPNKPTKQTSNIRQSFNQSPKIKNNNSSLNLKNRANQSTSKTLNNNNNNTVSHQQTQSKYLYYLKTQFPHTKQQVNQLAPQKINRLNEKLKNYIKKVNDQLTDLINQNMRILKANTLQLSKQSTKTVDDQIRLLMEQKKNGQVYIQTLQKQKDKLIDKNGALKEEQFQFNMDKEIQQSAAKLKYLNKQIYDLKLQTKAQGHKLTQQNNYPQKIQQIKAKLIFNRKEDEKNSDKYDKCQSTFQQLTKKTAQIQSTLSQLFQQAKRQNIKIPSNSDQKKKNQKMQELKKKKQNLRAHNDKSTNLTSTKINILKRDNQVQKTQIQEIQKKLIQLDTQINFTQQSSKNFIEDAKKKDLQPYIQAHLDFVYKNITQGNPLNKSNVRFINSNKQKKSKQQPASYGLKKYSSVKNAQVYQRSQSQAQMKPSFNINKKIPVVEIKAKQKNVLKLSQKVEKRVWKQQKKQDNHKQPQKTNQNKQIKQSKPNLIKKLPNLTPEPKNTQPIRNNSQLSNKNSNRSAQKQNEKSTSALGPKIKFKKQDDKIDQKQKIGITQKNSNQIKPKQNQNQHNDSKPQFKIKKAVKQKIQIPVEDLYLFPPTETQKNIASQNVTKKEQPKQQKSDKQIAIKKGPNFKLRKNSSENKTEQVKAIQTPVNLIIKEKQPQKIVQEIPIQKQTKNQEQQGINFGGRRQVQRKIQRKNQQSYV